MHVSFSLGSPMSRLVNSTGDLQQVEDLMKKQVNNYICSHKEVQQTMKQQVVKIRTFTT